MNPALVGLIVSVLWIAGCSILLFAAITAGDNVREARAVLSENFVDPSDNYIPVVNERPLLSVQEIHFVAPQHAELARKAGDAFYAIESTRLWSFSFRSPIDRTASIISLTAHKRDLGGNRTEVIFGEDVSLMRLIAEVDETTVATAQQLAYKCVGFDKISNDGKRSVIA